MGKRWGIVGLVAAIIGTYLFLGAPLATAGTGSCPGGDQEVDINGTSIATFAFSPTPKTIAVNQTVCWLNTTMANHTVTSDNGSFVPSGPSTLSSQDITTFQFTMPGTYAYHCMIHSNMHGTINVTPNPPTVTSASPAGPANDNAPKIIGSGASGSTITLYKNSTCTTAAGASGPEATFENPGIQVSVGDNTTTTFYATASIGTLVSSCSTTSVSYTEDSTLPSPPVISGTTPSSPGNVHDITVNGTNTVGNGITVYLTDDCSGATTFTGTVTGGAFSVAVTVPDNQTTPLSATSNDGTHTSPCSNSISYTEDSVDPVTTIDTHPKHKTPSTTARFTFHSEPGSTFLCQLDSKAPADCSSGSVKYKNLKHKHHTFTVIATDPAGNVESPPTTFTWKVS